MKYARRVAGAYRTAQRAYGAYRSIHPRQRAVFRRTAGNLIKGGMLAGSGYVALNALSRKRRGGAKSIHQRGTQNGTAGSLSRFNYGKRQMSKFDYRLFKTASKNFLLYNNASRLSASVGAQGASSFVSMFPVSEMSAISTAISSSTPGKTKKIGFLSCSVKCMITNQDLGNVVVEIYDCIARRDLNNAEVENPWTAWANSYADEGGSDTDFQIVGSTPFSANVFTQYFKVLKVTHLVLAQGQTHEHMIHFAPNKILNAEVLDHTAYGVKGLSCYSMIVYRGAPYNDSTTKTQVSTGSCNLDVVNTKQYKYAWIDDRDTNWGLTNNLPGAFTVSEDIMDIGSGAVEVDVNA